MFIKLRQTIPLTLHSDPYVVLARSSDYYFLIRVPREMLARCDFYCHGVAICSLCCSVTKCEGHYRAIASSVTVDATVDVVTS